MMEWWVLPSVVVACVGMFWPFGWLMYQDHKQRQLDQLDRLVNGR